MIRKGNALVIFVTISLLSGCSNKSFTNISSDLRKVDVLNKNNEIVKTYYQAFNKKVYDWLNVTCDFTKKKFKKIEDCKLTQLSKSFIKNQENENSPEKSDVNKILNKNTASNGRNSNSNNNNQAPLNNTPDLPSNNPVVNPNPSPNANDPWHN